jgi:hypothetical protein
MLEYVPAKLEVHVYVRPKYACRYCKDGVASPPPPERPIARGIAVKPDEPRVLFAGCGETTTGETGRVLRTANFGKTWEVLPLPTQPNATVWGLATHPADANRILAFSLFGEVYISDDAGDSWRKIAREFGEIRTAVWVPN